MSEAQFLEFSHWFMAALFVGWSAFFTYVLIRFRRSRNPVASHEGVRSHIRPFRDTFRTCMLAVRYRFFPERSNR